MEYSVCAPYMCPVGSTAGGQILPLSASAQAPFIQGLAALSLSPSRAGHRRRGLTRAGGAVCVAGLFWSWLGAGPPLLVLGILALMQERGGAEQRGGPWVTHSTRTCLALSCCSWSWSVFLERRLSRTSANYWSQYSGGAALSTNYFMNGVGVQWSKNPGSGRRRQRLLGAGIAPPPQHTHTHTLAGCCCARACTCSVCAMLVA